VARVATKACGTSSGDWPAWVTQYRLAYSQDCVTYNDLIDGAGNNQVNNILVARSTVAASWFGLKEFCLKEFYVFLFTFKEHSQNSFGRRRGLNPRTRLNKS